MTSQCNCPQHNGSAVEKEWACTDCGSMAECGCQKRGVLTGKVVKTERNYICSVARAYIQRRSGR